MDSDFVDGFLKTAFDPRYLKNLKPKHQKQYANFMEKHINLKGSDNAHRRNILQQKMQVKDKDRILKSMKLKEHERKKFLQGWEDMVKKKLIK